MRNKRPNGVDLFPPERIVLYVHGATYPSETAFDLPLGGFSWMDFLACRGFDVYLVDLRGYGQSTRPPEMERPPADSPPLVTTDVALRDVAAAVAHIMIFGENSARLYNYKIAEYYEKLGTDKLAQMKDEYQLAGADRNNAFYGYIGKKLTA